MDVEAPVLDGLRLGERRASARGDRKLGKKHGENYQVSMRLGSRCALRWVAFSWLEYKLSLLRTFPLGRPNHILVPQVVSHHNR